MAAERVAPALRDDAEQEARIAVWQAAQSHADDPKPLGPLLTTIARRAILGVASGRPMTGEEGHRGRTRDPLRSRRTDEFNPERNDASCDDHADAVALRVAVAEALDELKPWERTYVERRWLDDRPVTEVAAQLDMSPTALANAWSRRLRPLLTERLAACAQGGL